jgi:spermidine synthase
VAAALCGPENQMMTGSFGNLNFDVPFVVQDGDSRSLHFTLGETQSSMRVDRPDELHLDYTRTMMGFLLLNPRPRNITMIGLGGGSMVKFCRRYLPTAALTVVENNPAVIALRREFGVPDDDAGLRVIADDGAVHLAGGALAVDVLLVDGFDSAGQPAQLCSQDFYDDCFAALAAGGILVVNLHADHPRHELFCRRVSHSFKGNAMQVLAADQSNCVVFAARRRPVTQQSLRSRRWADQLSPELRSRLGGEFAHIGWSACALRCA